MRACQQNTHSPVRPGNIMAISHQRTGSVLRPVLLTVRRSSNSLSDHLTDIRLAESVFAGEERLLFVRLMLAATVVFVVRVTTDYCVAAVAGGFLLAARCASSLTSCAHVGYRCYFAEGVRIKFIALHSLIHPEAVHIFNRHFHVILRL